MPAPTMRRQDESKTVEKHMFACKLPSHTDFVRASSDTYISPITMGILASSPLMVKPKRPISASKRWPFISTGSRTKISKLPCMVPSSVRRGHTELYLKDSPGLNMGCWPTMPQALGPTSKVRPVASVTIQWRLKT